jgi:hypothetical protein
VPLSIRIVNYAVEGAALGPTSARIQATVPWEHILGPEHTTMWIKCYISNDGINLSGAGGSTPLDTATPPLFTCRLPGVATKFVLAQVARVWSIADERGNPRNDDILAEDRVEVR